MGDDTIRLTLVQSTDPYADGPKCVFARFDVKMWTMSMHEVISTPAHTMNPTRCNFVVRGGAVVFVPSSTLQSLGSWHTHRPLATAVLLQAAALQLAVHYHEASGDSSAHNGHAFEQAVVSVFHSEHNQQKHSVREQRRTWTLYNTFGVKLIEQADAVGAVTAHSWYGCTRESPRCFGTIVNDKPDYLARGRWTPPCCLDKLRKTARYVFQRFDELGVRYWLEGGSLLGAYRNGDVIPWDYDVDIGIFRADIQKIPELNSVSRAQRRIKTTQGFVWELAIEGDFYRVQYSQINHIHVDIFPFYEDDTGMMTKDTWIKSHRQDTKFASSFLRPLERMMFIGMNVSVPNNAREFLEFKFGKGAVENPPYQY